MDPMTPNQNEKKEPFFLYLLIAGLFAALIFQFFYFSHKMNNAKQTLEKPSVETQADSPFPYAQRRARNQHTARYSGPAGAPPSFPMANDFFDEDPFTALERIHSRFNNMMNTARTYAPIVMQQMNRDLSSDFIPAVDLEEKDDYYIVRADIPGLEKDKINITAENDVLIIQGIRETQSKNEDDKSGIYTSERSYGSFARTVALPGPVNETGIKADYKDGVLTVQVPKEKSSGASAKRIPVQ